MKFLIAATFKSNKTKGEVESWIKVVSPVVKKSAAEVAVAPSFPYLALVREIQNTKYKILTCSQDVSPFPPGSYTGAVNAEQLKDLGVQYCLVGHSERRRYFHETPAEVANKIHELIAADITPILCLSEDDIFPQLSALPGEFKDKIIYCYEPPSNIGGTETAPLEDIKRVIDLIRQSVGDLPIMYGGSVNADNLSSLLTLNLAGVLVSSASLDPAGFSQIIITYNQLAKD